MLVQRGLHGVAYFIYLPVAIGLQVILSPVGWV